MLKIADINPATIEDDELAAVMAALQLFTEVTARPSAQQKPAIGAWKSAALLEGTGRRKNITEARQVAKGVKWRGSSLPLAIISLFLSANFFASALIPARAQSLPPKQVRVALLLDTATAKVVLPDGGVIRDATTGDTLAELPAQSQWQITARTNAQANQLWFDGQLANAADATTKVATKSSYEPVAFYNSAMPPVELRPLPLTDKPQFALPLSRAYVLVSTAATDPTFGINGKLYRGAAVIKPHVSTKTNGIDVINHLSLEEYLLSVVPSEMPSGWPLEALKAQAVAARSYALANLGKHEADGYDIKATVDDQAYSGISSENELTNRAVHETQGQVLTHEGKPISAFFHSSSGGHTEVSEHVWTRPLAYLRAVPDYDDESPHFSWNRSLPISTIEQTLAKSNKNVGTVLNILPIARGVSPRVKWVMIAGTDKTIFVSGEESRKLFGLPSTLFNAVGSQDSYVFSGRGNGHGLGMSQWGAKKLAEAGYTAAEILSYYYKDVTLNQI
jgi:stage II sporulation protein D